MCTLCESSKNLFFVQTDVAWNQIQSDRIAASATNGDISVQSVDSGQASRQVWGSGESSRAVNKVAWHGSEAFTLASAHQDGLLKIWDTRDRTESSLVRFYQPRADAARFVQFDPNHEHIVAAGFENGSVIVWDRRVGDQHLVKIAAHLNSVQAISWNSKKEWQLATGGRDSTIKVWDMHAYCCTSESSSNNVDSHLNLPKPVTYLNTPYSVGHIAWRKLDGHTDEIASAAIADRSDISIWKLGLKSIPVCSLRAHEDGSCVGLAWLDCNDKIMNDANQSVLSVTKEGVIMIQQVKDGFFPRLHMSGSVTAISPRGHVAFQSSKIIKVIALYINL